MPSTCLAAMHAFTSLSCTGPFSFECLCVFFPFSLLLLFLLPLSLLLLFALPCLAALSDLVCLLLLNL